jgi:hypothetical protein
LTIFEALGDVRGQAVCAANLSILDLVMNKQIAAAAADGRWPLDA